MNTKISLLLLSTVIACTGCQTAKKVSSGVSKTTEKVKSMVGLGEAKVPEVDQQGVVDVSKATLEKLEQMKINMPTGQWVYIEMIFKVFTPYKTNPVMETSYICV